MSPRTARLKRSSSKSRRGEAPIGSTNEAIPSVRRRVTRTADAHSHRSRRSILRKPRSTGFETSLVKGGAFSAGRSSIGLKFISPPLSPTDRRQKLESGGLHRTPKTSIQRRNGGAFLPPAVQIAHRDVQKDVAARRLNANHQRFGVRAPRQPRFVHVYFRRRHFAMKSLVIQQGPGISDDHVCQFADRLAHHLIARIHFPSGELAG